jgi:serine/threonine-protein kinase
VPAPGDRIDRYELIRLLGEGGMASVWLTRHAVLGSQHALKVLNAELVSDDEIRDRFLAEGRIQAQLRHPNLLPVTDVVAIPGVAGLVMEYVDGPSLEQWLAARAAPPRADELRAIFLPILAGIAEAHHHGVIHRDLKPANILLERRRDGTLRPRIADFGIAKIATDARLKHEARNKTRARMRMGTLAYMSPEQITDAGEVDRRADVFALGAILYELATGRPAFDGPTEYAVMNAIVTGGWERPAPGAVDPRVLACIERALDPTPAERFPDCETFAAYLGDASAQPVAVPVPVPVPVPGAAPAPAPTPAPVAAPAALAPTDAPISTTPLPAPTRPAASLSLTPIPPRPKRRRRGAGGWLAALALFALPALACAGVAAWRWDEAELWWATHVTTSEAQLQRSTWTAPHGIRLRFVPAGEIALGSPPSESGRDRDEVVRTATLTRPVLMMETEVTQAQWRAVMASEPNRTRSRFWDGAAGGPCSEYGVADALPVTCVDWHDAVAFANALSRADGLEPAYRVRGTEVSLDLRASGYRLPTEAEWERAARWQQRGRFGPTDDPARLCAFANVAGPSTRRRDGQAWPPIPCEDGHVGLAPVASLRPNGLGLYDLVGNAWEWVWDVYDPEPAARAVTNPLGPSAGPQRVLRGGSYHNHAEVLRVANRYAHAPDGRSGAVGFRLVRTFRPADASNGAVAR